MNIIVTILIALVCFGVIIFVHELGHFLVAKAFKFKVNQFAIGMGPSIFSFGKGETKYSLKALPIGGFVAMEGEDEESSDDRAFSKKPAYQRLLVCLAGSVMNLILGFIILVVLTTAYSNLVPTKVIATFSEGSALAEKLQVGDEIISVNNLKIYSMNDVVYEFSRDSDKVVDMVVKRNGEKLEITSIPITTVTDETGKEKISLDFKIFGEKKTVLSVLKESVTQTVSNARLVFLSLVDLIRGHYSINELSGPIGVTTVISEAASYGFDSLLNVVAFITINVGVFNLLPLPALDGGKIFILIGEMITRKRLNQKAETIINLVGLAFLMLLMVFATYNDILKLF